MIVGLSVVRVRSLVCLWFVYDCWIVSGSCIVLCHLQGRWFVSGSLKVVYVSVIQTMLSFCL